jgi:hypothetical protein
MAPKEESSYELPYSIFLQAQDLLTSAAPSTSEKQRDGFGGRRDPHS